MATPGGRARPIHIAATFPPGAPALPARTPPRLAALLLALLALAPLPVPAAQIHVTTELDATGGPACTLRDAILAAETDFAIGGCTAGSGADTIDLAALRGTVELVAPLPTIGGADQGTAIVGPGADLLAVSGSAQFVVFTTTGLLATNRIAALTIRDGAGHCVYAEGNTVIEDARVTGCSGGAALDTGNVGNTLRVERTLVDANGGFAIRVGGVAGSGRLVLVDSTVSGNAGGLFFQNADGPGALHRLYASTLADNGTANLVVGFDQQAAIDGILLRAAASPPAPNCTLQGVGDPQSSPPNLISTNSVADDASCALAGAGDQQVADVLLGALADNGGPTATRALLEGSPAIDAGASACNGPDGPLAADQRGALRPRGAACDIGAFEVPEAGGALGGLAALAPLGLLRRRRLR